MQEKILEMSKTIHQRTEVVQEIQQAKVQAKEECERYGHVGDLTEKNGGCVAILLSLSESVNSCFFTGMDHKV